MKKKIAITMGEPGGIGPEVIAKALAHKTVKRSCIPVVIGDSGILRDAVRRSSLKLHVKTVQGIDESISDVNVINVLEIKSPFQFKMNSLSKGAGRAVVRYIKKAVELALNRDVEGIVTAPISKKSLSMAGFLWPGHTELLADLTGIKEFSMMFVSRKLMIILCTIHIPLKDVPKKITKAGVVKTIRLAVKGAELLGIQNPGIAVAGLNPHAGESGVMGREEGRSIVPAVDACKKTGIRVSGPYPPDVVFHKAYKGEFDIVVCMYHDQGMIPFKMLAFDSGVNMTVGLPFIRTSPDHGTAFDIAWQNRADPTSMIEAIKLAAKISHRK
ncbi:MAG: 4-hydroxythreonine-4-phosphate dehydrogenase PdxA [Nitrospiraceae bacterium]|nr:MAG: 4-hydroxythreonine-4-phosphate dehydrogenase PdxA [Nitrospiraceae bacterium]